MTNLICGKVGRAREKVNSYEKSFYEALMIFEWYYWNYSSHKIANFLLLTFYYYIVKKEMGYFIQFMNFNSKLSLNDIQLWNTLLYQDIFKLEEIY